MKVNVELDIHELVDLCVNVKRGKLLCELAAQNFKTAGNSIKECEYLYNALTADNLSEKLDTILQEAINTMRKGEA